MTARRPMIAVASLLVLLAAVFSPTAARAESATSYRPAMRMLIVSIDAWYAELDTQLAAVATKPEVACSVEYAELIRRGEWLHDDLAGTGLNAPAPLVGANRLAAQGLGNVVDGAARMTAGCDGAAVANGASLVQGGRAEYVKGMAKIRHFVEGLRFGR